LNSVFDLKSGITRPPMVLVTQWQVSSDMDGVGGIPRRVVKHQ
jgi:hypothetical protein